MINLLEKNCNFNHVSEVHDYTFNLISNENKIEINISHLNEKYIEFEFKNVNVSIANALRRLMIAEVPTLAIEHVFVIKNTSIIQDELIAGRLGMLPIRADPTMFDFASTSEHSNEKNTVVFSLSVSCAKVGDQIVNQNVLSSHLEWLPQGSQIPEETNCWFTKGQNGIQAIRPVHDDILLAVLVPGQEIILEAHCNKGTGREHAKWSPVATSWYTLVTEPIIIKKTFGHLAEELATELPGLIKLSGKKPYRRAFIEKKQSP